MYKLSSFLILFASLSFAADSVVVNSQINHSVIKSVFVIVNIALPTLSPLDDSLKENDVWLQIYESLLLKHNFDVITRSKISSILEEQKLSLSGLVNEKDSYKIGKLASADAVLFVNVIESSDTTVWELIRLIKIDTGEIVLSSKLSYRPRTKYPKNGHPSDKRESLFRRYDKLSGRLTAIKK